MAHVRPKTTLAVAINCSAAVAQSAIDNAISLLTIITAGVNALPQGCRLADGISLALDNLADELNRTQDALD